MDGFLAMVGIGLVVGLAWPAPLLVRSMLATLFGVVLPEEQYLEDKFGDEYRRYRRACRAIWQWFESWIRIAKRHDVEICCPHIDNSASA